MSEPESDSTARGPERLPEDAEEAREFAETRRETQAALAHEAERERITAELGRDAAERRRAFHEGRRGEAEQLRQQAEAARHVAEGARATAEEARRETQELRQLYNQQMQIMREMQHTLLALAAGVNASDSERPHDEDDRPDRPGASARR